MEGAKVNRLSGCKSTQADGITVLPSTVTPPEERILSWGGYLGGVPVAWTVNTLVHGKGLTYLDASPHISFTLSFSKKRSWRENHWQGFPTCCEEGDDEADMGSPGGCT